MLTTNPRIFCLNLHNGKLVMNLTMKEIANVKCLTDRCFSFDDVVVRIQVSILIGRAGRRTSSGRSRGT